MILRVYALYERSNVLLALLLVLWTLQLVFSMVGVFTGQREWPLACLPVSYHNLTNLGSCAFTAFCNRYVRGHIHVFTKKKANFSYSGCILTSRSLWFCTLYPYHYPACSTPTDGRLIAFLWSTPLVTDFIIFFLTIWRTRRYIRGANLKSLPTIHVLVRDGALYFFAIFSANLMNTLIYFVSIHNILT